jgi:hypoxanthine phosphoribosyltransferase
MVEQLPKVNCKKVTWDEVENWSRIVSDKIYGSSWLPDTIVAISRGGYVPARLICDRLLVGELVSLQISHWPSAAQVAKEAGVKVPLYCDMSTKRVLVVDDISDTGDSIIIAKDHIRANSKPKDVLVATLQWISESSKVTPDFYAEEVKGWWWYQYPWTRLEDVIGFIKRIIADNKDIGVWTVEEIASRFPEWYGVTFDRWFYDKAVESLTAKGYLMKENGRYRVTT